MEGEGREEGGIEGGRLHERGKRCIGHWCG